MPVSIEITLGDDNDKVHTGDGDDIVDAGAGNNRVYSGNGNDVVTSGSGNDWVHSGEGDDSVTVGDGNNSVFGGAGDDRVYAGDGNDRVFGGLGNDRVTVGRGDDRVFGGFGNDDIYAGAGNDSVFGGAGNDSVILGEGDDRVFGGQGSDDITGGLGNNTIYGGSDIDTARYTGDIRNYGISFARGAYRVADHAGEDADILRQIEVLAFRNATIYLDGTNNAPIADDVWLSVGEDGPARTGDLLNLAGAFDFEADALSVAAVNGDPLATGTVITLDSGALLAIDANGWLSYDPNGSFESLAVGDSTTDTATFQLTDGTNSVERTLTLEVEGQNDAPIVAEALSAMAREDDDAFAINLLDGASDVDAGETESLSVANVLGLTSGVTLNGSALEVDPSDPTFQSLVADQEQTIVIDYEVRDIQGATVEQTATVTLTGINDAPIVDEALRAMAKEDDSAFAIDLLDGARDVDTGETESLSIANVEGLASGFLLDGTSIIFDPADESYQSLRAGEKLDVVISYDVVDVQGGATPQTLTVTVTGANDVPVVSDTLSADLAEDDPLFFLDLLEGASDKDDGETQSLTVANIAGLEQGMTLNDTTLSVDPSDAVYQSLAQGETRTVIVSYDIMDVQGAATPQTASITVTGGNDAPTVSGAVTASYTEDASEFAFDLLANASDVDADDAQNLTVANLSGLVPGMTVINSTQLNVDPSDQEYQTLADGEVREIVISYDVVDPLGASTPHTARVSVTGTNDAPNVDFSLTASADQGDNVFVVDLLEGASDIDAGESATLSVTNINGLTSGVSLDGTSLTVDPGDEAFGSLTNGETEIIVVDYDIVDAKGARVAQSATITINGTNSPPDAVDDMASTEQGMFVLIDVLANDSDPDSDPLIVTEAEAENGTVEINVDGTLTYTPEAGFSGADTITYALSDGKGGSDSAAVSVTVTTAGTITLEDLDGSKGFIIVSGSGELTFDGWSVSSAGDVNNDGYDDLLVGAPPPGGAGAAYLIHGSQSVGASGVVDMTALDGSDGSRLLNFLGSAAGWAVTGGGDFNGDGIDDLALGGFGALNDGISSTAVFAGSTGGFGSELDALDANSAIFEARLNDYGSEPDDSIDGQTFGSAVTLTGDVNGDGIADLIVGQPDFQVEVQGVDFNSGAVYVVFGTSAWIGQSQVKMDVLDGSNGFELIGAPNDSAGTSIGSGDFNSDGLQDILIGANSKVYLVESDAGLGSSGSIELGGSESVVFSADSSTEGTQVNVASAGDVNNDGTEDVIVGLPGADGGDGKVYVVYGSEFLSDKALADTNGFAISGGPAGYGLGTSINGAGDVNGDGIDDMIIGTDGVDLVNSAAYVVFGVTGVREDVDLAALDGTNGFAVTGQEFDGAGYSVSGAGDINGDGFDDVVIGAPGRLNGTSPTDNAAYVVYGRDFSGAVDQFGTQSDETLDGSADADVLVGNLGNDTLNGNDGDDVLKGALGDDVLNGGIGRDVMAGGAGADTFAFTPGASRIEVDRILDFEDGDTILLSGFSGVSFSTLDSNSDNRLTEDDDDLSSSAFFGGSLSLSIDNVNIISFTNTTVLYEDDLSFA